MRFLHETGALTGRVLDYGCGRGDDVQELERLGYDVTGWDPHWRYRTDRHEGFDTVVSVYVANVLGQRELGAFLRDVIKCVGPGGGVVYVAIRRDIQEPVGGRGCTQTPWSLEGKRGWRSVAHHKGSFEIYMKEVASCL